MRNRNRQNRQQNSNDRQNEDNIIQRTTRNIPWRKIFYATLILLGIYLLYYVFNLLRQKNSFVEFPNPYGFENQARVNNPNYCETTREVTIVENNPLLKPTTYLECIRRLAPANPARIQEAQDNLIGLLQRGVDPANAEFANHINAFPLHERL